MGDLQMAVAQTLGRARENLAVCMGRMFLTFMWYEPFGKWLSKALSTTGAKVVLHAPIRGVLVPGIRVPGGGRGRQATTYGDQDEQ